MNHLENSSARLDAMIYGIGIEDGAGNRIDPREFFAMPTNEEMIESLRAKLAPRKGREGYAENCREIEKRIAELEGDDEPDVR